MGSQEALQQELVQNDAEYRDLYEKHQELKRQLQGLYQKSILSEEDELEVKRIKHEKLRLKDQMSYIARSHAPTAATA